MKATNIFLSIITSLLSFTLIAQKPVHLHKHNGYTRCATVEYDLIRRSQNPNIGTNLQFEAWLNTEIKKFKQQKSSTRLPVLTIPVVVHVIHNGDAIGSGENITDAQILSQIQVLNEDFRKMLNTNGHNTNPVGADIEIEFCLAAIDPNGNATSGIDRVNMGQSTWDRPLIESNVKPQTIWDPNNYLNMWTCRFGGSASSLLGYAQFPDNSSGLPGLNFPQSPANTDGVIMNYNAFGTTDLDDGTFVLNPTYNLGRTTTHEVGHWLGLRHIWGDGNCSADDFCNDTPIAGAANYGCPTGSSSCNSVDMIENYMDYSNDACMNVFTEDQKTRIRTVLSVCPRRASLVTSTVCSNATAPPVCSISSSSTTVIAGNSINFNDNSTGSPTSWSWNFDNTNQGGVSPATSTTQNPNNITYNNVGTYQVQLTATNANGSCTSTTTVNVVLSSGCDTLSNFVSTDSLTIYLSNEGANPSGYISGWNNFNDLSKAEYYNNYSPYTHVTGMDVYFYGVHDSGNGATIDFNVWGDNSGQPNTILGTASATLSQIDNAVGALNYGILHVTFSSPVNVGGTPFYCGITMNGFGVTDSLAVVTSTRYTPNNSGWEQWANNTWHPYSSTDSWNMNLTHYIRPYVTDQPVSATISATPTTTCSGTPITLNATGINSSSFSWYMPGATTDTASGPSTNANYTTPGTYTAYLLTNGVCRGRYIDSIQITITNGPTLASTPTNPGCSGNDGQIVINANNGTAPYQYSIDGGNNYQNSNTFTGLNGGAYVITVIDASGCSSTESVSLTNGNGTLNITTTDSNPNCGNSDGSILITTTGGSSPYLFSIDNGQSFTAGNSPYTFSSLGVGTYNIIVQDNNGCQGFSTVNLTNANAPSLNSSAVDVSCNGLNDGQLYNNATGGTYPYQYSIDGGSNFQQSGTFGGLNGGNYTVLVQDANGCQTTNSVTINETSLITHSVTTTDASCGNDNGNIAIIPSGGTAPYQYSINGGSSFQSNGFFNTLAGGTYNVVISDANGCSSTISSETVQGTGIFSVTATTIGETCMDNNGSITVVENGGASPYQYSINGGLNFQSSGLFTGLSANNYNVTLQDANGCLTNTSATITNQGGFNLTITPNQTICFGNSATVSAGGAGSGSTYSWDNGLNTGTIHIVSPTTTTTYTVIANDTQGCSRTASTVVTVNTQPTVSVTPSNPTICNGDSVTLLASGAQSYVWNNGTSLNSITVAPSSQSQYVVIGQNGNCNGTPVNTTVNVNPSPTIVANGSPLNVPVGGTVNFNNNGSVATSYNWNFGDGTNSTQGSPSHTYNSDGTYNVILSGDLGNCSANDTIVVIVGNGGPTSIENFNINEAITIFPNPNNGIFNLAVTLPYYQNIEYIIFDAVGKQISKNKVEHILQQEFSINLNNQAKGIYYLRINTDLGQITKQVSIIK